MKKLVDENGNVIEGSISEKIWLDTDGTKLGLKIKVKIQKIQNY